MRTLYCYAIEYTYGKRIQGHETLLRFRQHAERDAWVNAGPFNTTEAGYREAVDSRHPAVRRARSLVNRKLKAQGEQWQPAANAWAEWIAL